MSDKNFERKELTKKEEDKIRKEYFEDVTELNKKIRKERGKKLLIIFSIILLVVVGIKIFFGTIEIYNPFGYPSNKARFYKVSVNDEFITVGYNLNQKITLIPFLINFNNSYLGQNNITNDLDGAEYIPDGSDKYIIDISSYSCYEYGYQVECLNDEQNLKENNDTKYTKLKITRTNNPYEIVYDGKYINDITKYVKDKGIYCVSITAEYSLVEAEVYFYFARR